MGRSQRHLREIQHRDSSGWDAKPTILSVPFLRGVNFNGAQLTAGAQWPKDVATDYFVTTKKMNIVRLLVLWESVQPTLNGPLSTAQVTGIQHQIDLIIAAGAYVMIEPHNYGRRTIAGTDYIVGETPTVTIAHFADFWSRIATRFRHSKMIYNLVNEPHDQNTAILTNTLNAAIVAIRATRAPNLLAVPGNNWTNRYGWNTANGAANKAMMANIVDPYNNWCIDYHLYFDAFSAGQAKTIDPNWLTELQSFTTWMKANNKKAICGEFGCDFDDANLAVLNTCLAHFEANQDVWRGYSYFAGGGWWNYLAAHFLRLDPFASHFDVGNPYASRSTLWDAPRFDMPQMSVLETYLPNTKPVNLVPKSHAIDAAGGGWFGDGATMQRNAINGPYGPLSATAIKEDGTNAGHGVEKSPIAVSPPATDFAISAVLKKGTRDYAQISIYKSDFAAAFQARFNLNTGSVLYGFGHGGATFSTPEIVSLGDGWYWVKITGHLSDTPQTGVRARAYGFDGTTDSYAGVNGNAAFYIEHFQVEVGATVNLPRVNI